LYRLTIAHRTVQKEMEGEMRYACRLRLGLLLVCAAIGFASANAADRYDVRNLASLPTGDRIAPQRPGALQFALSFEKDCSCPSGARPVKSTVTCTQGETRSGERPIVCEPCECIRVKQ
jgi:hypothetical protein